MLSVEAIKEFKSLYFKEFGITLTDNQALDFGTKLIRLVKAWAEPVVMAAFWLPTIWLAPVVAVAAS